MPLQYWMRWVHRMLGYLVLGMTLVFASSGVILVHRTGDFMKRGTRVERTLEPGLDSEALGAALKIKRLKVDEETANAIYFSDGRYDKVTGRADYVQKEVVSPFNTFISLHKMSDGQNRHIAIATTVYGVALLLLALTALFMYKPAAKPFKVNMMLTALGIAGAILLLLAV